MRGIEGKGGDRARVTFDRYEPFFRSIPTSEYLSSKNAADKILFLAFFENICGIIAVPRMINDFASFALLFLQRSGISRRVSLGEKMQLRQNKKKNRRKVEFRRLAARDKFAQSELHIL